MQKKHFLDIAINKPISIVHTLYILFKAYKLGCYSITNEILNRFSTEASPFHGCQYFN